MICTETILPLPGIPHRTFQPKTDQEMVDLYRSADVFVSTSWMEGFGLPPLEAMVCGTPVVTTNSGGILDFCEHGHSAYIVPPKNPESIAEGIMQVLTDQALAQKLVRGGLHSASRLTQQNFETNIVQAIEDIYHARISK
ncbi:glycosyltransferase [Fodinisporobacter ferrooxydans]|uniref:Glycosyltransferase n=1 Tax=Fodinisporobacter ferrooxydans TaxID=2901836 RepID=A0ABY4CJ58_9BACL|nr:glycosyltransferase [Alicyclobacillaceae bacterium MYW30-H2]